MVLVVAGCYDGSVHGWTEPRRDAFGFLIGSAASSVPAGQGAGHGRADSDAEKDGDNILGTLDLTFAYKPHESCLKCLAASKMTYEKDGKAARRWLASGGTDEIVRVYDLNKLVEVGVLFEHSDTVLALEFVGNKFLLSGGADGKLCVWRTRDWNCIASLKGHKPGPVTGLAIHPNGKVAFSTSNDNSLRMWNLETARPASRNRLTDYSTLDLVAWAPDGQGYALVADSRNVLLFHVGDTSGKPSQVIKLKTRINALCFLGADGECKQSTWLSVGLENGSVQCYPLKTSKLALRAEEDGVKEFSCGGRVRSVAPFTIQSGGASGIAAGLSTGALQFWNLDTLEKTREDLQVGSGTHLTCMIADIPARKSEPSGATFNDKGKSSKKKGESSDTADSERSKDKDSKASAHDKKKKKKKQRGSSTSSLEEIIKEKKKRKKESV